MHQFYIYSLLLLFASGCHYRVKNKQNSKRDELRESVARLSDIPDVPLYAVVTKVVKSEQDPDQQQIFCRCHESAWNDVKMFYMEEMERLGWKLQVEYQAEEVLLEFVKPDDRVCIVALRNKNMLVISILHKKEVH